MSLLNCLLILVFVFTFTTAAFSQTSHADLVLYDGIVATVDKDFTLEESLAVKDGKIVFVGKNEDVASYIGSKTQVLKLDKKLVLPGLVDAHAHLSSLGDKLSTLNISDARSLQEVVAIVEERVKNVNPGEWIFGGRWDHTLWDDKRFPIHDLLSEVSPNNPVYLRRVDGNSSFVNKKAMEIAGITKDSDDPFGGQILRKKDGQPTGVLVNRAMNLVKKHFPPESLALRRAKIQKAMNTCIQYGLTGVHEAGIGPEEIKIYKELIDNDEAPLRVYAMLGEQQRPVLDILDLAGYFKEHRIENYADHRFSVLSVKLFFDGALGSRGAAFFEPYADDRENKGLLRITPEYITKVSKAALQAGMGVNTHCIGIRGNRLCLDAYEAAFEEFPKEDHRFRIEHAQIVRPEDIDKFALLGVIPAMQPTHCTSDMDFVAARVGHERAAGAYAWRAFLNAGLKIPCGSDFPVESPNPMLGIYAAITRMDVNQEPSGGWFPEQRMTIQEAIRGFTEWAAYGAFQEDVLGSIEKGKYADFTILDKNILEIEPEEILTTKTLYTIVHGEIQYQAH